VVLTPVASHGAVDTHIFASQPTGLAGRTFCVEQKRFKLNAAGVPQERAPWLILHGRTSCRKPAARSADRDLCEFKGRPLDK